MTISISAKPIHHTPLEVKLPVLKVLGLGGGGSNAINRMIELGISGVEYIAANTDSQALKNCLAPTKIQLGPRLTRGLGAGGDPRVGEGAAEESFRELNSALTGADMVFLAAGMGGGTGSGSIPVAARVARALGAVTIAIVTTPFSFEVGKRQKNAREGLNNLYQYTDTLITVPNDRLLQIAPKDLPLELAFRMADDMLRQGIQGISELVLQPGLINVDFAHIRQMMINGGGSLLSIGFGEGEHKASQAIEQAIHHPLLDSIQIENATGIIANFSGGSDLAFMEVAEALNCLQEKTNNQAEIVPGVIYNEQMEGRCQVIMVITGLAATPLDTRSESRSFSATTSKSQTEPYKPATEGMFISTQNIPVSVRPEKMPMKEPSHTLNDLDIPAFLRRRAH
jgi:cell division protein FtsZ